jgi:hypothetical protein
MDESAQGDVYSEYSTDGIAWSNAPQELISWINGASFDVKIRDDGSQLEIWVASAGLHSPGVRQTKYCYGTIGDADDDITWNAVQTIDADIYTVILGTPHCIAIARTDNGEIVVAFTEDFRDMGKNYHLTKIIGSDGDGAAPNWSGEIIWDDPSGSSNNQDKDEVWFGLESFSSSYPDRCFLFARVANPANNINYDLGTAVPDWEEGGAGFTNTTQWLMNSPAPITAAVISGLIDDSDYSYSLYRRTTGLYLRKSLNTGDDDPSSVVSTVGGTLSPDACTLTLDTGPATDVLYAFYHKSADSVDWNYKTSPVDVISWSSEETITYAQDVIALSSWSRDIENCLHIAGQFGTTVWYHELSLGVGPPQISEQDDVTVGDAATIDPLLLAAVSETEDVTVGDTPTLELTSDILEQDDITVGDTATLDPVSPTEISETEPITVGDAATLDPLLLSDISETDDVTIGDTATLEALIIDISESEAVTVADVAALSPVTPTDISESDAVTVVDTPTVSIPTEEEWDVSEQDDITVGDTATVDPVSPTEVSETEPVTVGDTPALEPLLINISETEDITVVDTPTVTLLDVITLSVSEAGPITVGDTATLDPLALADISETEDITVGDAATIDALIIDISESEDVTVGDIAALSPVAPTDIVEQDDTTVVDTPTVQFAAIEQWDVSETEDIIVVDTPTVVLLVAVTLVISEADPTTVGDIPTVSVPEATALAVSETDPVIVGDTATLGPVTPTDIDVSEGVTVTDTPTVLVPEEDVRYISEQESVTVGEIVTLYVTTDISESELVTVGDGATLTLNLADIIETDTITVGDTATLGPVTPTEVSEADAVTVIDVAAVVFFQPVLTLSVGDAVSVTDLASVGYYIELLGLDKPKEKPYEYQKEFLDMEPIVRADPLFAMRQEQQAVMEANRMIQEQVNQVNTTVKAAGENFVQAEREAFEKKLPQRRRGVELSERQRFARDQEAQRVETINQARRESLKKARAAKKRKAKKKK